MSVLKLFSFIVAWFAALLGYSTIAIVAITVFITAILCEYLILTTTTNEGYIQMALVLTDEQKVSLSLSPKTAAGNPAALDGAPVWSVSDPSVLELAVAEDGLSAVVSAKGLGAAQVSVVADADLDAGEVRELSGVLDILVVAAEAATLGVSAGVPELK